MYESRLLITSSLLFYVKCLTEDLDPFALYLPHHRTGSRELTTSFCAWYNMHRQKRLCLMIAYEQ